MGPDTYVPSCTVMTGLTVPVAVTDRTIGPSVTLAVTILVADELGTRKYQPPTMIIAAIASIHTIFFMLDNFMGGAQLSSRYSCVASDSRRSCLLDVAPPRRFRVGSRPCLNRISRPRWQG